jgi:hypothetical protein
VSNAARNASRIEMCRSQLSNLATGMPAVGTASYSWRTNQLSTRRHGSDAKIIAIWRHRVEGEEG